MLFIIGIAVIIVATYQVYKTAGDTGRNAIAWAFATFAIGFGIQQILLFLLGVGIGLVMTFQRASMAEIMEVSQSSMAVIINLSCLFLSFIGVWLVMRYVSKIPEEKAFVYPLAPPSNFNQNR